MTPMDYGDGASSSNKGKKRDQPPAGSKVTGMPSKKEYAKGKGKGMRPNPQPKMTGMPGKSSKYPLRENEKVHKRQKNTKMKY